MTEQVTETQNNHSAKIEHFQRNLRVKLSEKEIAERSKRAAHLVAECDQKEESREAANKQAKAQIAELEAELRRISTEVRDESTYRVVRCERVFYFRTGNVVERRLDTGEVLSERAMSEWERQTELDLERDDIEEMERKSAAGESDPPDSDDEPTSEPPEAQTAKKRKGGRRAKRNGASA